MRVLIVYPRFYLYGGAETLIVKLCNFLTKNGVSNSILTTAMIPEVENDLNATDVIVKTVEDFSWENIQTALKKGLAEKESSFDIINIHNFPTELCCQKVSKPVVWMCNEPELYLTINNPKFKKGSIRNKFPLLKLYWYEKLFLRFYIRHAVVADEYNYRRFRSIFGFKPTIINYGVDFEFFSQNISAEKPSNLADKFIILQSGMLTQYKNQMESLKVVNELKEKIPNIYLIFAGGGLEVGYKASLERYIKKHSLENYVEFKGHVSKEEQRQLYHISDVMLHPIKPQGGWLSPFEYLSLAKPVVVSPEMTASSIIKKENIGIVTDKYADTIMDIYHNKDKYNEMAQRGKIFVQESLSWDNYSQKMLAKFESVIKEIK